MPLLNSSFEDAGANPGDADQWTLLTFVAAERIAGFGPVPHRAWEDFERWSELKLSFGAGDLAIAFFDPLAEGFEDFEDAWDNDHYLTELPSGQVAVCPFGGGAVEDLEAGWANDTYVTSWASVTAVTGIFDGEPREDFEDQWRSNESFAFTWAAVTSATAMFDAGAQNREDFENEYGSAVRISEERVDAAEVAGIVAEAAATRNGWKVILARCAPTSRPRTALQQLRDSRVAEDAARRR